MKPLKNEDSIKYETRNPISQMILRNFFVNLKNMVSTIEFKNIYEAGCGNGYVTEKLVQFYPQIPIKAIDIDNAKISIAKARMEGVDFSVASIYDIPQEDNSCDLVVSTEVLEHLEHPLNALKELCRISRQYIVISVPNEPIWRIANMVRLKYIKAYGNSPGHINHWNRMSFCAFLETVCDVKVVRTPFPFTIVLCQKR